MPEMTIKRNFILHYFMNKIGEGVRVKEGMPRKGRETYTSIYMPFCCRYSEKLKAPGGDGYYFNDYCNWQTIPQFKDFVHNSPAAQIVATLMKSKVRQVQLHLHLYGT